MTSPLIHFMFEMVKPLGVPADPRGQPRSSDSPFEEMAPERVRELRLRENASQAVSARYLNVTTGLVNKWERGEKRPRGASLKLLTLVAKNSLGAVA